MNLYQRVLVLRREGHDEASIRTVLAAEGAPAQDIAIAFGAAGMGAQPHPGKLTGTPTGSLSPEIEHSDALGALLDFVDALPDFDD